jgi:hypothetical protein
MRKVAGVLLLVSAVGVAVWLAFWTKPARKAAGASLAPDVVRPYVSDPVTGGGAAPPEEANRQQMARSIGPETTRAFTALLTSLEAEYRGQYQPMGLSMVVGQAGGGNLDRLNAALALLSEKERKFVLNVLACRWVKKDRSAWLEFAKRGLTDALRTDFARELIWALVKNGDLAGGIEALALIPEGQRDSGIATLAIGYANQPRAEMLAWLGQLPDSRERDSAVSMLGAKLAARGDLQTMAELLRFASTQEQAKLGLRIGQLQGRSADFQPGVLDAYEGAGREGVITGLIETLPLERLLEIDPLKGITDPEARRLASLAHVRRLLGRGLEIAGEWALSRPAREISMVVGQVVMHHPDTEALAKWIEKVPNTAYRDAAWETLAWRLEPQNPGAAGAAVAKMVNPDLRKQYAERREWFRAKRAGLAK